MKKLLWSQRGSKGIPAIVMLFQVIIFLIFIFRGIMVNPEIALNGLEKRGYTQVTITEKDWFFVGFRGCAMVDAAKIEATVTNSRGKRVKVLMCSGWPFKAMALRTE